jgi:plasmid stabilization system protein ParE
MRRVRLTTPANLDYAAAITWYQENQPGIEREFEIELQQMFGRIEQHPEQFRKITPTVRKAQLPRFKHKILFTVEGDEIGILSIYHPSRNPEALRRRF